MPKVIIDLKKCNGCGTCISVCPSGVLALKEEGGSKKANVVNIAACIACKACELQCPEGAIKVEE